MWIMPVYRHTWACAGMGLYANTPTATPARREGIRVTLVWPMVLLLRSNFAIGSSLVLSMSWRTAVGRICSLWVWPWANAGSYRTLPTLRDGSVSVVWGWSLVERRGERRAVEPWLESSAFQEEVGCCILPCWSMMAVSSFFREPADFKSMQASLASCADTDASVAGWVWGHAEGLWQSPGIIPSSRCRRHTHTVSAVAAADVWW